METQKQRGSQSDRDIETERNRQTQRQTWSDRILSLIGLEGLRRTVSLEWALRI